MTSEYTTSGEYHVEIMNLIVGFVETACQPPYEDKEFIIIDRTVADVALRDQLMGSRILSARFGLTESVIVLDGLVNQFDHRVAEAQQSTGIKSPLADADLSDTGPYATAEDEWAANEYGTTIPELRRQRAADDRA
jgi:hypothetical protein